MRYIKSFICGLSKDVHIKQSTKSTSIYITLDGGFTVRLSDHQLVVPFTTCHLDIVPVWNKEKMFLMYVGDTHIPLVKTRDEVKQHIKITYENWVVCKMRGISDMIFKDKKEIHFKQCQTVDEFIQYNVNFRTYGHPDVNVTALLGSLPSGTNIPKKVRTNMIKWVEQKKINYAELFHIVVTNKGKIKTDADAVAALDKYNNNEKNQVE